jgi:hypothetical protein
VRCGPAGNGTPEECTCLHTAAARSPRPVLRPSATRMLPCCCTVVSDERRAEDSD